MATEWRIWADIQNEDADVDAIGTKAGSAVNAGAGGSLTWWLEKAGIIVPDAPPSTGQIWPR